MLNIFDYKISEKDISLLLKNDNERNNVYNRLIERRFYVGEADVARKNLNHWQNVGLLPFEYDESGWRKFSLVEFIWLRVISELRNMGMPLETIKIIKSQVFSLDIDTYKSLFIEKLEQFAGELPNREEVIKAFKQKKLPVELWQEAFNKFQLSYFTIIIFQIVTFDHNACLAIEANGTCNYVTLTDKKLLKKNNENVQEPLINRSFTLINVRKIIQDFFSNDNIRYDNDYIVSFLSEKEREIIEKIREHDVKNIYVTFANAKPLRFKLTPETNIDDFINELMRLLKKNKFKEAVITTQKEKIISYKQK